MSDSPIKLYQESTKFRIAKGTGDGRRLHEFRAYALKDPERFWAEQARFLTWFKQWEKVLEWNAPFARWFVGGQINASYNILDKHMQSSIRNETAVLWEGENEERRKLTYSDMYTKVNKLANGLKKLGVRKGDRVTIYLPMIPELPMSMLACARIGATHSVIFSGFSAKAIVDRVNDSQSKVIITADGGYRRGKIIKLKEVVDEAVKSCGSIKSVITFNRANIDVTISQIDKEWDDVISNADDYCEPEKVESTHPLFILYTSGTTGKPKGVVHGTGGYLTYVYATTKWIFDIKPDDVYWCTADIGWVTGHTYIVYGPMLHGATVVMYEGAPDYPKVDRFWSIVERYGVSILYTTPTALRMFMRFGDQHAKAHNLNSLRLLGTVGESINPEVWLWYYRIIGQERCPIVDTWWQTETGAALISNVSGIEMVPMKPGSATFPMPSIDAAVVDEQGREVPANTKGYLVIRKPWPGMLLTLWNDDEKYKQVYWSRFSNVYYAGDYALIDEDGYVWLLGRADDVLKVAGHRLGTMELESAFVSHKAVAEAAVSGKPHDLKGEVVIAFLVLREGYAASDGLKKEIAEHIRNVVGAIATPEEIYFVSKLPKTRSGKIMRRLMKAVVSESGIGDVTTLEDEAAVDEVRKAYEELKKVVR
ncbi:MAG: acetate--CoA ligase [Nitrososphaerales archaeon]